MIRSLKRLALITSVAAIATFPAVAQQVDPAPAPAAVADNGVPGLALAIEQLVMKVDQLITAQMAFFGTSPTGGVPGESADGEPGGIAGVIAELKNVTAETMGTKSATMTNGLDFAKTTEAVTGLRPFDWTADAVLFPKPVIEPGGGLLASIKEKLVGGAGGAALPNDAAPFYAEIYSEFDIGAKLAAAAALDEDVDNQSTMRSVYAALVLASYGESSYKRTDSRMARLDLLRNKISKTTDLKESLDLNSMIQVEQAELEVESLRLQSIMLAFTGVMDIGDLLEGLKNKVCMQNITDAQAECLDGGGVANNGDEAVIEELAEALDEATAE